jgi:hypothetical protein
MIKWYNGNDPKINRVLPLPQGNHVTKLGYFGVIRSKVTITINRQQGCFHITLVLYIGSLPNLTTWLPSGRGRILCIVSDLDLWPNDPKINRVLPLPQGNHVVKIQYTELVIIRKQPLSKIIFIVSDLDPIYFGVITIIPFDHLFWRAYFVMHTFLV